MNQADVENLVYSSYSFNYEILDLTQELVDHLIKNESDSQATLTPLIEPLL
jgi:hypothetical protein